MVSAKRTTPDHFRVGRQARTKLRSDFHSGARELILAVYAVNRSIVYRPNRCEDWLLGQSFLDELEHRLGTGIVALAEVGIDPAVGGVAASENRHRHIGFP